MWPERLSPGQLAQIAPALERAIRPFLRPDEAERIVAELQLWISMRARSRDADAAPEHEGPRA